MAMHAAVALNRAVIDIHSNITCPIEWGPYYGKYVILGNYLGKFANPKIARKNTATILHNKY